MILHRGITGEMATENGLVDGKLFKTCCYQLTNKKGVNILSFNEPKVARNHYEVEIMMDKKTYYLFLNDRYPFLACATSNDLVALEFIHHEIIYQNFKNHFSVLSIDQLNEPIIITNKKGELNMENEHNLSSFEIYTIKYWQTSYRHPIRIGDCLYNFWD